MAPSARAIDTRALASNVGFDSAAPSAGIAAGEPNSPSTSAAYAALSESGCDRRVSMSR